MDRRRFLAGLAAVGSAGCNGLLGDGESAAGSVTPAPVVTPTDDARTRTAPGRAETVTLAAGEYAVALSRLRVRPSVRAFDASGVSVRAEDGVQYLAVSGEAEGPNPDTLPLTLAVGDRAINARTGLVDRPGLREAGTAVFPVPVDDYERGELRLEADGETDRWPLPASLLATLGAAPAFAVESVEAPDSVAEGESFPASFTVANRGDRDARFLAEFGTAVLAAVPEVSVTVPAGGRRTYTREMDPFYGTGRGVIPLVLDWGLDRRRVEIPIERATTAE